MDGQRNGDMFPHSGVARIYKIDMFYNFGAAELDATTLNWSWTGCEVVTKTVRNSGLAIDMNLHCIIWNHLACNRLCVPIVCAVIHEHEDPRSCVL